MKNLVYVPQHSTGIPELRKRIEVAVVTITPNTLIKVQEEVLCRRDVCSMSGAHVEHLPTFK